MNEPSVAAGVLAQLAPGAIGGLSQPGWLWLLLPAAILLARGAWRGTRSLAWPALPEARAAGARAADGSRALGLGLRAGAVLALVAVLAQPLGPARQLGGRHEGLDLVLVVDASASMRALDTEIGGAWQTRLELARRVVARFAARRVAAGDRVGLVVFGESAFTQCPLTSDGRLLAASLTRVRAGMAGDSTALGDALALAVERASGGEQDPAAPPQNGPAAGRLVVLLTDGRSNAGLIPLDVATALAVRARTRVHTVGIGTRGEVAVEHPSRQGMVRFERQELDLDALRAVADATGGRAFQARRAGDLAAVYDEIDGLERVPRTAPPQLAGRPAPEPLLALAGVLVLLEIALTRVLWRALP